MNHLKIFTLCMITCFSMRCTYASQVDVSQHAAELSKAIRRLQNRQNTRRVEPVEQAVRSDSSAETLVPDTSQSMSDAPTSSVRIPPLEIWVSEREFNEMQQQLVSQKERIDELETQVRSLLALYSAERTERERLYKKMEQLRQENQRVNTQLFDIVSSWGSKVRQLCDTMEERQKAMDTVCKRILPVMGDGKRKK